MATRNLLAAIALVSGVSAGASGQIVTYNFTLDGLQEVPPNASPGFGSAIVTLNTLTNELTWNITFGGLVAPETAAHFHAPAPPGVNAGVVLGLPIGSPKIGSAFISDTIKGHILAGLAYVNIHTSAFPGGEIRGQVVPAPAGVGLLAAAGLIAARRRRG